MAMLPAFWVLVLIVVALVVQTNGVDLIKWDRWAWVEPRNPMENFFRRNPTMFRKSPNVHCECPPNKECQVEFKMNEDAIEFLQIRGVLNENEAKEYKKDLVKESNNTDKSLKAKIIAGRRMSRKANHERGESGELVKDTEHCCCPPRSLMMPTFITDQRFEGVVNRLKKQSERVLERK